MRGLFDTELHPRWLVLPDNPGQMTQDDKNAVDIMTTYLRLYPQGSLVTIMARFNIDLITRLLYILDRLSSMKNITLN